ncbi:hypothetical protein [Bradyrhizobium tropiciagri]|uniref:hypothetical protein n=1 Tax=Bradyrhizobium tropiciagri TaxID=312253 RepID=UPI00067AD01A|nr:hypothetical protein [Bradyrhizobium tropiciagri]
MPAWRDLGLKVRSHGGRWPIAMACFIGLMFGAYMAVADASLFRSVVPAGQAELVASLSTIERIGFFAWRAVVDEVIYRFILMSAVVWLLAAIAGRPQPWCYWAAIVICALVFYPAAHLGYLATLDRAPLIWLREVSLHGAALWLWGYLYWRHGLVASIVGHISAHFSLQPLLSLFFS